MEMIPKAGTVVDRWGMPCPRVTNPNMYPLFAECENGDGRIMCADGTADWYHPDNSGGNCKIFVTKVTPYSKIGECALCGKRIYTTINPDADVQGVWYHCATRAKRCDGKLRDGMIHAEATPKKVG